MCSLASFGLFSGIACIRVNAVLSHASASSRDCMPLSLRSLILYELIVTLSEFQTWSSAEAGLRVAWRLWR